MKLEAAMLAGPFKRPAWSMIRRMAGGAFEQWSESSAQWYACQWSPCPADILADDYVIATVASPVSCCYCVPCVTANSGFPSTTGCVAGASAGKTAALYVAAEKLGLKAEPIGGWQGPEASDDAPSDPEVDDKLAFDGALECFLMRAQTMIDEYYAKTYQHVKPPKLVKDPGRRYVRIWRREVDENGALRTDSRGSAFCFIDKNGDILKPDGWKKPAKHARGNIFDENPLAAVNAHGTNYLR